MIQEKLKRDLAELASTLDGKLLRLEELPIDRKLTRFLLSRNLLKTKPALTKSFLRTRCMRCGNETPRKFAEIPCQKCNKAHFYCRNCMDMGRLMECDVLYYWNGPSAVWSKQKNPCSWEGTLTRAQEKAALRIKEAITNREKEILTWAVCGAGKTEMLFPGISKALEEGMRICLATPRADVVRELKPRLEKAFRHIPIQALYGGSKDKHKQAQLIIATTHQLLRYEKAFDVMIIDEVDAFPFHADPALPFAQKRSAKRNCTTIYLTATPREDLKAEIRRGKLTHVFVPVRYHGHPLPVPKLKMWHSLNKELPKLQSSNPLLYWLLNRQNPKRQLLVFVPTVERAGQLKTPLTNLMLKHKLIHHPNQLGSVHASDPDRERKVVSFREKTLKVILTTTILERGVTFPSVDVAILDAGHDVFDEAALVQIAGRAGRNSNDPTGEVLFFHDGKTEAMLAAIYAIKQMNKRGGF